MYLCEIESVRARDSECVCVRERERERERQLKTKDDLLLRLMAKKEWCIISVYAKNH